MVVLVMVALAAAASAVAIPWMPGTRTLHWWIVLPVLAAGTTVSMRRATTAGLHRGGREVVVVPVGQYFFAAALLLDPVWIVALSIGVPSLRPPPRSIGVRCHRLITMLAASATFWALFGHERLQLTGRYGWRLLGAVVAAMLVHSLTETVLVTLAVRFTFGTKASETNIWNVYSWTRDLWELAIGAIGAILAVVQPGLLLLMLPIAALAVEHVRLEREVNANRRDPRTQLFNVRGFDELAAHEVALAASRGSTLTLVLLDLDHLREVNNTYGHRAGDTVIGEVGRRIQLTSRREDVVARIGGEEFVALLPEVNLDAAVAVAERIRAAIGQQPIETHAGPVTVTASLGVAEWDGEEPLTRLFDRADAAMYEAKQAGRNRVAPTA